MKLVLLHRADSIYDDRPDTRYDFPRQYLKAMEEGVGDRVIYYEPVKAGNRGYFAAAKVQEIIAHPTLSDRYIALIEPGSYLDFVEPVARLQDGTPLESALTDPYGFPKKGGAQQLAVRRLPEEEFNQILDLGLSPTLETFEAHRYDPPGAAEPIVPFERPVIERLTKRRYRDIAFRRAVWTAYDERCAISGLRLRNGGGRPEVQAAHIRPVAAGGNDSIRNGLALSGTVHWMFDRGLIGVAEDHSILISHNKVPGDVADRLLGPSGRLYLPREACNHPHPDNLKWHRENVFGQVIADEPPPWG